MAEYKFFAQKQKQEQLEALPKEEDGFIKKFTDKQVSIKQDNEYSARQT